MISILVNLPDGDMIHVNVYEAHQGHVLYRMVWLALPDAVRPEEMWRMMLYRGSTWLRPSYAVVRVEEMETLDLWIDLCVYTVEVDETRHANHPNVVTYRLRVGRNGLEVVTRTFYAFPEEHRFFLPREVRVREPFHVEPRTVGHQNFMVLLLSAPLSACAREWVYASLYDRFDWINDGMNQSMEPDNPLLDADNGEWMDANEDTIMTAIRSANVEGTGGYTVFSALREGAVRSLGRVTEGDSDNDM
jgi:hypothetical protein